MARLARSTDGKHKTFFSSCFVMHSSILLYVHQFNYSRFNNHKKAKKHSSRAAVSRASCSLHRRPRRPSARGMRRRGRAGPASHPRSGLQARPLCAGLPPAARLRTRERPPSSCLRGCALYLEWRADRWTRAPPRTTCLSRDSTRRRSARPFPRRAQARTRARRRDRRASRPWRR